MLGQRKAVIALFPLVTTAARAYITGVSGMITCSATVVITIDVSRAQCNI